MPTITEILRVSITWLEPGEITPKSRLCIEHPCPRNVVTYWPTFSEEEDEGEPFINENPAPVEKKPTWRIDVAEFLHGLHSWEQYDDNSDARGRCYQVDELYTVSDPPVEMLVPVVLFDFDLAPTRESVLSYLIEHESIDHVFKDDLLALQNIGWHLWRKGRANDCDRYGVTVTFHGMWTVQIGYGEDPDIDWWFDGFADPALISATVVPPQEKPERKSTLAHLRTHLLL